jgi:hypothetical protein
VRRRSRRAFLEQLEGRQLLAGIPDPFPTDSLPGDFDPTSYVPGTKVSENDPRVQSWATAEFKQDSLIVRFADHVSLAEAQATIAAEAPGATIQEWDDEYKMAFLELPEGSDEIELGHRFLRASNTLYAEPNFIHHIRRFPNDPSLNIPGINGQWSLHNTGLPHFPFDPAAPPNVGLFDADIDAPEAWDLTVGSPEVVIAVLDTGINYFEIELQENLWQNPRELPNGIDDDGNGYIDDIFGADPAENDGDPYEGDNTPGSGHGTSIFGVIAAPGDDANGITGVTWNSKIMSVKVSEDGGTNITVTGAIGGYKYVERMKTVYHINIVAANISYGGSQFSFAEFEAIKKLTEANVLVVTAVDNAGVNHDIVFDYPSGYNLEPILAVTSSDDADFLVSALTIPQVGYGRNSVDLVAPGVDIISYSMPYIDPTDPNFYLVTEVYTGTSYAAAHVTGVAALVNSLAPGLSAIDVKNYIMAGADRKSQLRFLVKSEARLNARGALDAVPKNTLSGTVFQDANNNRTFDQLSEIGLAGWTVYLDLDNDSQLDPNEPWAVTAADGTFVLDAYVVPGTYRLRQVMQPDYTQTTPNTNGGAHVINLTNRDMDVSNLNFGNRQQPGNVTGTKFLDLNANGVRDDDEPGMPGVMFYVDLNDNGRLNVGEPAAFTDANGNFTIPNLQPGTYNIREVLVGGYLPTVPNTVNGNNLPDPVLSVTVTSNTTNDPPLLFGNRVARDYGDLPDVYGTTAANNGPSHGILPGFMLGTVQDYELDGVPSVNANGDDLSPTGALDDEDGVVSINLVQGQPGTISLVVTNSGHPTGFIQAWIDFGNDGSFDEPGDQILKNYVPVNGLNANIPFTIPASATLGPVYARVRYGYERDLGPNGPSQAGEVEDYRFTIFANRPIAVDDQFPDQLFPPPVDFPNDPLIKQESVNNVLDVLRNDPPPASGGTLSIVPGSFPSNTGNGTITLGVVDGRDVLIYTPRGGTNPFTGRDTFTYRVTDGVEISDPAVVMVEVTPKDPRAVDDTYSFVGDVASNPNPRPISFTMDVIANDVTTPSAPVSIVSFTQPVYPLGTIVDGPTVTLVGNQLVMTPPAGFVGTVQFTYTIDDAEPSGLTAPSTATVTVQVTNNPPVPDTQYLAMFSVEVVDARGNLQGTPNFRVDVGEVFYVNIYSEDLRLGGTDADRGVEAAFIDLLYDRNLVAVNLVETSPGVFRPDFSYVERTANPPPANYDFDRNGFINAPEGIINELGGVNFRETIDNPNPPPATITEPPLGKGKKFVVSVGFDALAAGTTIFRPDPAEDSANRSAVLLAPEGSSPDPVEATDTQVFLVASPPITIKTPGAPEFVNPRDPLDVNADSRITAIDALQVVNELNLRGARSLQTAALASAGELPPAYYVDTNNDGRLSAFDALRVINWLNLNPIGAGPSAGEDTSGGEFVADDYSGASSYGSAGEYIAPEDDAANDNGLTSPLLFNLAGGGSGSDDTAVGEPVAPQADAPTTDHLHRAAIDELMAAAGNDEEHSSRNHQNQQLDFVPGLSRRLATTVRSQMLSRRSRS